METAWINTADLFAPATPGSSSCELQARLLDILGRFISTPLAGIELEIDHSLGNMGELVNADRVSIFNYDHVKGLARRAHAWSAAAISPGIEDLRIVPEAVRTEWMEHHRRGFPVHIANTQELPPGPLREALSAHDIQTMLALPMMHGNDCLGFVGLDWVKEPHAGSPEEHQLLNLFVRMLVSVHLRQQCERERQLLQSQLAHAVRMESMGRLAGGVAHDFNNMLTVINCHTRLVQDKLPPDDPLRPHLTGIEEAAQRSAELTRRLLTFARKQEIKAELLDLNKHVSGTLSMLRRMIGEHIDLSFQPGSYLWPVMADVGQLDQVLANLCVNARDAIGEDPGRIMIETANVTHEHAPGDIRDKNAGCSDYVVLTLTDTGCGMDQDTIDHIFEPFFTTKDVGKGTGLGLATVFGIVHHNNGFIEVTSRPGQGANFSVFLPRAGV